MNLRKVAFIITLILLELGTACTEPPPPTLNAKDRDLLDSLYRDSIRALKPIKDSICDLTFDQRVAVAVDSIMKERQEEIRKQLERIQEQ